MKRHVEDHQKDNAKFNLKKKTEMVQKLNKAFACKIASSNQPNYIISPEEIQFLYHYGQLALRTKQNPIHYLNIDKRTLQTNVEQMAQKLMDHTMQMIERLIDKSNENGRTLVIAISHSMDHKFFSDGSINLNLGAFTMTVKALDLEKSENNFKMFRLPVQLFPIPLKDGKTNVENEKHIIKYLQTLFNGKHIDSCSIQADGGIIKKNLIASLAEKYPSLKPCLFLCLSHTAFLSINHSMDMSMDDCGLRHVFKLML